MQHNGLLEPKSLQSELLLLFTDFDAWRREVEDGKVQCSPTISVHNTNIGICGGEEQLYVWWLVTHHRPVERCQAIVILTCVNSAQNLKLHDISWAGLYTCLISSLLVGWPWRESWCTCRAALSTQCLVSSLPNEMHFDLPDQHDECQHHCCGENRESREKPLAP